MNDNDRESLTVRCPGCGERVAGSGAGKEPYFPFCSQRCKLTDLSRWFDEEYRIESEPGDDEPAGP